MALATASFRFLDLPGEIRLMVYEFLPRRTMHYKIVKNSADQGHGDKHEDRPSIVLITECVPVQLLATCRLIHEEATPVVLPKVAKAKEQTPRILADGSALCLLPSIHAALMDWFAEETHNTTANFGTWVQKQKFLTTGATDCPRSHAILAFIRNAVGRLLAQREGVLVSSLTPTDTRVDILFVIRVTNLSQAHLPYLIFKKDMKDHRIWEYCQTMFTEEEDSRGGDPTSRLLAICYQFRADHELSTVDDWISHDLTVLKNCGWEEGEWLD